MYRPADRGISSSWRAARVCRLLIVTEVCPAPPSSQLRPEAGPCPRPAPTARRAGVQSHDALFRSAGRVSTSGVSKVGEGPRSAGTRRPPVQDRITHPGRFYAAACQPLPVCGAARRSTCHFPALPHPRQHRDVLAPMCIACALHTRSSAHTTPTLPPPRAQAGGDGAGLKRSDVSLHLRPIQHPGRLERHHHRGRRLPPPPASLAADVARRLYQEASA